MSRVMSFAVILALSIACLPSAITLAQESKPARENDGPTCQNCPAMQAHGSHAMEFNLPGVDFPFGVLVAFENEVESQKKAGKETEITISCKCELVNGVPFFSTIPSLHRIFTKTSPVNDHPTAEVPFLSNLAKRSQLYTNGIVPAETAGKCCAKKSKCGGGACDGCPALANTGVAQTGCSACSDCKNENKSDVRVVSFVESVADNNNGSDNVEMLEEMLELRLENQRLEMEVEVVEQQIEMMREMSELREENAVLRTRLEFFEKHHIHAAAKNR